MERSNGTYFRDLLELSSSENKLFDASQYEFFGRNLVDEVELGGLDDQEDKKPLSGPIDNEYHLFEKEEGLGLGSLSDVDDLASTFAKTCSGRPSLPFLFLSTMAKLTRARRSPSGSASGSSSRSCSRSRSFSGFDSHSSSLSRSRSFTSSSSPSWSGSSRSRRPLASTQKTQVLNLILALTSSATLVFFLLFIYFYCKKTAKSE
ncbi:hypothetical protein ACFX19_002527 [Malus domestica]